ncbi:MAG: glycosyltransferase family 2 protein [Nitrospirae bacterium]|nr:glycosyltransferase family 2 protein [Nitrospirota bacterium]
MNISIVIPAYNEEKRIGPALRSITDYLREKNCIYEIIVVDDCSSDETGGVVSAHGDPALRILRNDTNRGKGYSVKRGILDARHPLVLFSDSDLSTPIEELDKFVSYINEGYDIVIASRNLKESNIKVEQPFYRQALGKTFPLLVNLFILRGFKDTQCGFKLFRAEAAKKIARLQTLERFSFDVEILYIAKKMGMKIKEAPVVWIDKKGTKVNPLRDGLMMLIDIFKIRYNNLSGKYETV